jgi:hypothetical protein
MTQPIQSVLKDGPLEGKPHTLDSGYQEVIVIEALPEQWSPDSFDERRLHIYRATGNRYVNDLGVTTAYEYAYVPGSEAT